MAVGLSSSSNHEQRDKEALAGCFHDYALEKEQQRDYGSRVKI